MNDEVLNPSEAARRLGVSAKALRLYEQRGLLKPVRTEAGWRAYGPGEMARAGEIAALRRLGLSLAEVGRVLAGAAGALEPALAAHEAALQEQMRGLAEAATRVKALRADVAAGRSLAAGELGRALAGRAGPSAAFDLPWPWGGERFELVDLPALTWIIGPLGSGKTRLAKAIAEALPDAAFLGLDRSLPAAGAAQPARVDRALGWLAEDGAAASEALRALLGALEAEAPAVLVVDMVEQDLDEAAQAALAAWLRRRGPGARPLVLMTRSSAMLDLAAVTPGEAILYCPANHSPPMRVLPYPGAAGYEAVATCLAAPEVRARTAGLVAVRPDAA